MCHTIHALESVSKMVYRHHGALPHLFIPEKEASKHENIPILQERIGKKFICTEMCMTKTKNNMDSHSYKHVHDKNQK